MTQIHLHGEIISRLWSHNIRPVFARQDFFGAVLQQFAVAFYSYGDENLGFGFWRRDVEGDVVEVGDDLID